VINQYYDPGLMPNEFVIKGNAAVIKCTIPSFVADFVYVTGWVDDEGTEYHMTDDYSDSGFKYFFIRKTAMMKLGNVSNF
jgi:hypothetical protein